MKNSNKNITIDCTPDNHTRMLQFSHLPIRVRLPGFSPQDHRRIRVVIRTNLNQAHRIRKQVIDQVEKGQSYSTDFYDIPARYDPKSGQYAVDVLLSQVGYFEFIARAESTSNEHAWVKWSDHPNVGVSVTPLPYARDNSLYCAFIRQFADNKHLPSLIDQKLEKTIIDLEKKGACVIPPTGNFENFIDALPFIIKKMGMKIIHLLPINPVPTSYGRMGMVGSPYATTDCLAIEPSYATFSRYRTIEDQFIDLTSTIHDLGAKVFLDMVINHTGWASTIHFTHRHWRRVDEDGKIVSPGAWGTIWGDLVELDYHQRDLWQYMAEVFLTWCRRGIDGFRLDAGYMVPLPVWRYIISKVREQFPDTLFLLEGLGGPWQLTEELLTRGQMNWAYSELFQNYSHKQIADYLKYARNVSSQKGVLVHYAETHDNDRLAKKGKDYARMRLDLAALTSYTGAWGITNGVEWLATEKIDVHRNTALHWDNPDNLVDHIAALNRVISQNPAFWLSDNLDIRDLNNPDLFAFTRATPNRDNVIACLINLNTQNSTSFRWNFSDSLFADFLNPDHPLLDLLNEKTLDPPNDKNLQGTLLPGQTLLLRLNPPAHADIPSIPALYDVDDEKVALIYRILLSRFQPHLVGRIDQETLLRQVNDFNRFIALVNTTGINRLIRDPIARALAQVDPDTVRRFVAIWTFDDTTREFLVSADQWLVAHTQLPCTARLKTASATLTFESIPAPDGVGHFAYFPPIPEHTRARLTFNWKLKEHQTIHRKWQDQHFPILSLASQSDALSSVRYPLHLDKNQLRDSNARIFLTNDHGAYAQIPATPAKLFSKYDTLLAVTPNLQNPTQRISLVKTVNETVRIKNKCFDLDESFFSTFSRFPVPLWEFVYDDGEYRIRIHRSIVICPDRPAVLIRYKLIEANTPITLTSKFYIEARNLHDRLIATDPIRDQYLKALKPLPHAAGLQFTPDPNLTLTLRAGQAQFIHQPHWNETVHFPEDAQRGLDPTADTFTPGVFQATLKKGDNISITLAAQPIDKPLPFQKQLSACSRRSADSLARIPAEPARKDPIVRILTDALDQFIIHTPDGALLLAGFPWLGQKTSDSLQCIAALLTVGRDQVAKDIIIRAAKTEHHGLLKDWLSGGPDSSSNIESPLRLTLAIARFINAGGDPDFLDQPVESNRTLRQILQSIFEHFTSTAQPTAHSPLMDPDTGLLWCPAGSTWMNTTNPQATPRAGYPVEIQPLWYQALDGFVQISPDHASHAEQLRNQIQKHFSKLFWIVQKSYLADFLHAGQGTPPHQGQPNTALRFNQLAAIGPGLIPLPQARKVVQAVASALSIPAALRSLADKPLDQPLEIRDTKGNRLTDPSLPYRGQCIGDETQRRLAYHNGTAWPWAWPAFLEAQLFLDDFSEQAVNRALAFLEPVWLQLTTGGIGSLPEMTDANYPHHPRGCLAHALTVAKTLELYMHLKYNIHFPTKRQTESALQPIASAK